MRHTQALTLDDVKRIADSTVRRLSMYLRYLEDLDTRGQATASSDEVGQRRAGDAHHAHQHVVEGEIFGK